MGFFCTKGRLNGAAAGLGKMKAWPQAGRGQSGQVISSAPPIGTCSCCQFKSVLTGDPARKHLASPLAVGVSGILRRLLQGFIDKVANSFIFKMVDGLGLYFRALI